MYQHYRKLFKNSVCLQRCMWLFYLTVVTACWWRTWRVARKSYRSYSETVFNSSCNWEKQHWSCNSGMYKTVIIINVFIIISIIFYYFKFGIWNYNNHINLDVGFIKEISILRSSKLTIFIMSNRLSEDACEWKL